MRIQFNSITEPLLYSTRQSIDVQYICNKYCIAFQTIYLQGHRETIEIEFGDVNNTRVSTRFGKKEQQLWDGRPQRVILQAHTNATGEYLHLAHRKIFTTVLNTSEDRFRADTQVEADLVSIRSTHLAVGGGDKTSRTCTQMMLRLYPDHRLAWRR